MVRFTSAVGFLMLHAIAAKKNNGLRGGEMVSVEFNRTNIVIYG